MVFINTLIHKSRFLDRQGGAPPRTSLDEPGPARIWTGRPFLTGILILASALPHLAGCGHATVPCPTPTQELDRLREETEQARSVMDRELQLERALAERRGAEERRLSAVRASLDSLRAAERR